MPSLLDGDRQVIDDVARANLLNTAFASKFTSRKVDRFPSTPAYDLPCFTDFCISEATVRDAVRDLQIHKACGPDGISARIIKECSEQLVAPLCILFRKSTNSGIFPGRWSEANIVPIHKKGSKKIPLNYRSVSLLPLFGKLLEKCIYASLFSHVRPALTEKQHGFLPQRSCETNLAILLKTCWDSISDGNQTDIIYTDYSAAFQSVNHELLAYKLQHSYNITGNALNWIRSYLTGRKQRVLVNGKCSGWIPVLSGTPEGSQLSPLLFALFVNDLPDKIKTNCLLFADDVKLFHKITSRDDPKLLQKDLDQLSQWSADWKLSLNPTKCKALTVTLKRKPFDTIYSIQNSPLDRVSEMRDLGILIDPKLNFVEHVNVTVSKANRALGLLIRSFQTGHRAGGLKTGPILAAYFANVRSILEYGSVIWGGAAKTHLDRLEKIQHKFLIWLAFYTKSTPALPSLDYSDLLAYFKVTSLTNRRRQFDILFVYKILMGRIDSALLLGSFPLHIPCRVTRAASTQLLHVPFGRVDTIKRGIFVRAVQKFNEFVSGCPDADPFRCTFFAFKSRARSFIMSLP